MSHQPPTVTAAMLQRAEAGLEAARDRAVRQSIQAALEQTANVNQPGHEPRLSGGWRRWLLRSLTHALFRVTVEYQESLPSGPLLIAANHLSHWDPLLLLAELPTQPYAYVLGDSRTLYNHWWKRSALTWAGGVIPLDRWWREETTIMQAAAAGEEAFADLAIAIERDVPSGTTIQALRQIDQTVQAIFAHGDSLMIFPEGRLGQTEGRLQEPLKRGTAIYGLRAGVPIVPVVLIGTQDLYLRKHVSVRFGPALHLPKINHPKSTDVQSVMDTLQITLKILLPDRYQEPQETKLFRHAINHMLW